MKLSNARATGLAVALAGSVIIASTASTRAQRRRPAAPTGACGHQGSRHQRQRQPERAEAGHRRRCRHTRFEVKGLTPGLHGVHLHAVGKCEPDFTAAGGHFDPGPAGNPDPDANHPFHMGDIPNLEANASGAGRAEGRDDARDAVGRPALAVRRRRQRNHRPWESGPGHHRRAEIRRQRRTRGWRAGCSPRSSHRNQPFFTGRSSPVAPLSASVRGAATSANAVVVREHERCHRARLAHAGDDGSATRRAPLPGAPRSDAPSTAAPARARSRGRDACAPGPPAAARRPAASSHCRRDVAFVREPHDALARLRLNRIDRQRERHRQVLRQGRALEDHRRDR